MGKNKKPKSIGRLIIDLTPLLDVIFIVLIVVLAGQDTFNMEADQKFAEAQEIQEDAEQELADMEASVKTYENQLEIYEELNEKFNVITIVSNYALNDRTYRRIKIKINGHEPELLELNPSNSDKQWIEFRTCLENVINEDVNKENIISIKVEEGEKMLYRDYEKMKNIINELQGIYPGKISVKE